MSKFACFSKRALILIFTLLFVGTSFSQYNTVVDMNGSGSFTTIQAAINAAPAAQKTPYVIFIKKGKYHEVVTIPSTKPFIQLIGESLAETIISYDNYSGKPTPTGGTFGTSTSATVNIGATDCMLMNLSIENATGYGIDANAIPVPATGDGPQALALSVTADRVVFYNCRFNGGQDTVYTQGAGTRNYFKNCYIDGNTDFIFGDATVIFDTCVIYPRTRLDNSAGGFVTAVNTKAVSKYGYVFRDCKLSKNRGYTNYTLGRPWQSGSGGVFNKTVYLNTLMGSNITATGWNLFDANSDTNTIYYGEYNSLHYDRSFVNVANRVTWSHQLSSQIAANYYNNDSVFMNANTPAIATWSPAAEWPVIAAKPFVPEISISNLLARKNTGKTNITWNITFPMIGVTCDLYKSADKVNYTKISSFVSTEDTACNFNYIDSLPAAGTNFYYLVKASKSGLTSITSDTGIISSTPTLFAYGVLGNIIQGVDAPSNPQIYQISGINLIGNVTITPPIPFEVSIDGTTWYNNSSPLVIVPTANSITNKNIYVRINGSTPGTYSDSIRHTTFGGVTVPLYVKGTMLTVPLLHDSKPLIEWPLTTSFVDSLPVRATGIIPSVPTLSSMLGISTLTTQPAFSAKGVAFANDPTVGKWIVGAALNRNCYVQFTVVADSLHQIRIDTLLLNSSNTGSANGTIAVVYSRSGFTKKDSTDIATGIGTSGLGLPANNYGAFAHPASIGKTAANNDSTLRFLPDTSLILNPKDSLTIRLYYGLGSSNTPRFTLLKNVIVMGHPSASTLPLTLLSFSAEENQGITALNWSTSNEVNISYFLLEKSNDGLNFITLTSVDSKNEASVNSYEAIDIANNYTTVYYRLKIVDKEGKYTYSKIVANTTDNSSQAKNKIYPNPVKNELTLLLSGSIENVDASIVALSGKELMRLSLQNGAITKTINVSRLSKGGYLLVIRGKQGVVSTLKFNKD